MRESLQYKCLHVNVKFLTFAMSESQKFQEILKTEIILHLPVLGYTNILDGFRQIWQLRGGPNQKKARD